MKNKATMSNKYPMGITNAMIYTRRCLERTPPQTKIHTTGTRRSKNIVPIIV